MKSTALAASIFLGAALAVPPATPKASQNNPTPTKSMWSAIRRAADNIFPHRPAETVDPSEVHDWFDTSPDRHLHPSPHNPHVEHHSPVAGVSSKGREPIDNAEEKGCMPVVQVTIPWYKTFVLYNCECGDECPQVKRGCRLDAFIEIYTGNTLILYTCPPMCTHGALSVNAVAALEKRALDDEEEDVCYSMMDDGINNAPEPLKDTKSWDLVPEELLPKSPVCLGFTAKLYEECLKKCNNSPYSDVGDDCPDNMESTYQKMLKALEVSGKETVDQDRYVNLADIPFRAPLPHWCDWTPLPIEDDGQHGSCGNVVREFCRTHDCHDG